MSDRKQKILEKRARREKDEQELAYLEGLIRLGKNDEAIDYLMNEHGATRQSAERIVARYAGAVGEGRHSLSLMGNIAVGIIFASLLVWAATTVVSQRLITYGDAALSLYLVHWLVPLVIAAALIAVALLGKGSAKTRLALGAVAALILYIAVPLFYGATVDMRSEPITRTIEVSAHKHYGDPRIALVPKGEDPDRRRGHFVPRDTLEGIDGNRVELTYWPHSGVVQTVKEAAATKNKK